MVGSSEIIELLKLRGFSESDAKKTYQRWYAWLNDSLQIKVIGDHFNAVEEAEYDQLVIVKDIDADLICPHHLLPVSLVVHIGYLPDGKILGLSKFARVAKDLAFPVTQENYTKTLVEEIMKHLKPRWCMAIVIGIHSCMRCRGVRARDSKTITSAIQCDLTLVDDKAIPPTIKEEFMSLVGFK